MAAPHVYPPPGGCAVPPKAEPISPPQAAPVVADPGFTGIAFSQSETSSTSPRGTSLSNILPPEWVVKMLESIHEQKNFLRAFTSKISEESKSKMRLLSARSQIHVAWATLHSPRAWSGDVDASVQSLLRAHALTTSAEQSIAPPLGLAGGKNMAIQIKPMYHCGGIGTGAYSLDIAVKNMQNKYPHVKMELLGAYSSETNPYSKEIEHIVFKKMSREVTQLGQAEGWPAIVDQNIKDWQQMNFVLAPVTTAPCTNLSIANTELNGLKDEGVGGLRTMPTAVIHACYEGDCLAASALPAHRYASFMEFPQESNDAEREALDEMYGKAIDVLSHDRYRNAKRHRKVRTSPVLPRGEPVPFHCAPNNVEKVVNGWRWKGNLDGSTTFPDVTLRKFMPVNMEKLLFNEELAKWERASLDNMRMVHESGAERYVSRPFWMGWMGHEPGTPVYDAIEEHLPCQGYIVPTTGEVVEASTPGGEPCGQSLYCDHCNTALKLVSLGWDVKSMSDYCSVWLETILRRNLYAMHTTDVVPKQSLVHRCGKDCSERLSKYCHAAGA